MGRRGRVGERATEDSSGTATMQFLLVDRVVAWEAGTSISTIKAITLSEEYLADHFPTFPVFPGVLMLEMLVESAAWLVRASHDFAETLILLREAKNVTYRSFVVPGQTLCVTATVQKWGPRECVLKAAGTVAGASTVNARLTLERFNLSETEPGLAESDRISVQSQRELFAQLWSGEAAPDGAPARAE